MTVHETPSPDLSTTLRRAVAARALRSARTVCRPSGRTHRVLRIIGHQRTESVRYHDPRSSLRALEAKVVSRLWGRVRAERSRCNLLFAALSQRHGYLRTVQHGVRAALHYEVRANTRNVLLAQMQVHGSAAQRGTLPRQDRLRDTRCIQPGTHPDSDNERSRVCTDKSRGCSGARGWAQRWPDIRTPVRNGAGHWSPARPSRDGAPYQRQQAGQPDRELATALRQAWQRCGSSLPGLRVAEHWGRALVVSGA